MNNRFFDIVPPSKEEGKRGFPLKEEIKRTKNSERKTFFKTPFFFIVLLVILLIFGAYYSGFGWVEISVWPKVELLNTEEVVNIKNKAQEIILEDKIIPGEIIYNEKVFNEEFLGTGKKKSQTKSTGTIRIYNNYSQKQTIIKGTRFQPPLEKFKTALDKNEKPYFYSTKTVIIDAKKYADVEVIADSAGEKYNIEPTTFSIPGLVGTPKYTFIYGQSFASMFGGTNNEVAEVTENDISHAKKFTEEKAKKETEEELIKGVSSAVFLPESIATEFLESSSTISGGKFFYRVKAKSMIFIFKKENIENFIKNFLDLKLPKDESVDLKNLKISYEFKNFDRNKELLEINLKISVKKYKKIEEESLKENLRGKANQEAMLLLKNENNINRVEIKAFPFWLKNIPQDKAKINIKINVD